MRTLRLEDTQLWRGGAVTRRDIGFVEYPPEPDVGLTCVVGQLALDICKEMRRRRWPV